ncbi:MAG: DUF305 domain-containing protein, partial [Gemmatimonadota bacterium]|nr:DUF305 domain-containing protein [Gemmatimonadota bacterium]
MRISTIDTSAVSRPRRAVVRCAVTAALVLTTGACATTADAPRGPATETTRAEPPGTASSADAAATADSLRRSYTEADVRFMRGMIHHHAQAVEMARMAPTHGASERIRTLTSRILASQRDEIALMRDW